MRNRVDFTEIELIDLPFVPFQENAGMEKAIYDYVSNCIIKIEKRKRRENNIAEASKNFSFYKSNELIGIDISSISKNNVSYLSCLTHAIHLYPIICINNPLDKKSHFKIGLHSFLKDNGYILPMLPSLNPADVLYTNKRYGDGILKLIRNEIESINLDEVLNQKVFSKVDIFNRFPNLVVEQDNILKYKLDLCWLGVDDDSISNLLNYLFNSNDEYHNINIICKQYNVDKTKFDKYAKCSMLFEVIEENVYMRFKRKNILHKIKSALLQNFENQLYEHNVIDTTGTNYQNFNGTFTEYHEMDRLFKVNETYSIKFISTIKNNFYDTEFDRIVLVQNKKSQDLKELLSKYFDKEVTELSTDYDNLRLFPFEQPFNFEEKILLIIDICNKGKLLSNIIEFIRITCQAKVVAVYSFIIDTKLNLSGIISEGVLFKYYIEKNLHNIDTSIREKQQPDEKNNGFDRFLTFWETIDKFYKVDMKTLEKRSMFNDFKYEKIDFLKLFSTKIYLNKERLIDYNISLNYAAYFLHICRVNKVDLCIFNKSELSESFKEIFSRITNNSIKNCIIDFNKPEIQSDILTGCHSILLYDDSLNTGQTISKIISFLDQENPENMKISVCVLFSRKNERDYNNLSKLFLNNVDIKTENRIFVYYSSSLPYYLFRKPETDVEKLFYKKFTL